MKTLKDFLEENMNEMLIAVLGDWKPEEVQADSMKRSRYVTLKDWGEVLSKIKTHLGTFELRKHKTLNSFILGSFETDFNKNSNQEEIVFREVLFLVSERDKKLEQALKSTGDYKKLITVRQVFVDSRFRGSGLAYTVYRELVNKHGFVLMGVLINSQELDVYGLNYQKTQIP